VYLHPNRWNSLGLSLIEAMLIGMPVIAVGATEAVRAVPSGAGVVSTDLEELKRGVARFIAHPDLALEAGQRARQHALRRFSHAAFLAKWDVVLTEATGASAHTAPDRKTIAR
jgi:glycosyltransferase involved in cell wall biosynthesis